MRKVIPKNIADEMTKPYIDDAVEKQIKAADVPPRNKLNISFENAGRIDDNKEYKSNQEAYEKNHGKLYDMTHNNTIPWKNYVVYLVLLSLLTTVFTFSKYMSSANGNGNATVAKFDVSISYEGSLPEGITVDTSNVGTINFAGPFDTSGKKLTFKVVNNSDVVVVVTTSNTGTLSGATVNIDKPSVQLSQNDNVTVTATVTPNTKKVGNVDIVSGTVSGNVVLNIDVSQKD